MTKETKPDYSDYKVWRDVELTMSEYNFGEHEEYTPEQVYDIAKALVQSAKDQGLEGCYLKFESTREPYDDYLGPASVIPCGYRKITDGEKKEQDRQDYISKVAKDLKITFHEASVMIQLKEKGVI